MKTNLVLREFVTLTNEDGSKITRITARISDHADPTQQAEYITFQFSVDLPTVRNGALLRQEVLEKARDIIQDLYVDFGNISQRIQGR